METNRNIKTLMGAIMLFGTLALLSYAITGIVDMFVSVSDMARFWFYTFVVLAAVWAIWK